MALHSPGSSRPELGTLENIRFDYDLHFLTRITGARHIRAIESP